MLDYLEKQPVQMVLVYEIDDLLDTTKHTIDQLKHQVKYAQEKNVPLYVISSKPDNDLHRNQINQFIESNGGFHDGMGGFKPEHIIFRGKKPTLNLLKTIHQKSYPWLPKVRIMFAGSDENTVSLVKEAGYSTSLAKRLNPLAHLSEAFDFLIFVHIVKFITTLGNYDVLRQPVFDDLLPDEHLVPVENGDHPRMHWRMATRPDYSFLADVVHDNNGTKRAIFDRLKALKDKRQILFNPFDISMRHIRIYSYSTAYSIEDLATKELIILLGSTGIRKALPLKNCIAKLLTHQDFHKKIAIIGFPADSGVDMQPVGHEQTLLGAQNRLKQLRCVRDTLTQSLNANHLNNNRASRQKIYCLSVESGIGLLPVEKICWNGSMQLASSPLYSPEKGTWHLYDQTHILLDTNDTVIHDVTRPAFIQYELLSKERSELEQWFDNGQPTVEYYKRQSKWSIEMLAKLKENADDAYPCRNENHQRPGVSDLIEERLHGMFRKVFSSFPSFRLITAGLLVAAGFGLFAAVSYQRTKQQQENMESCGIS